MNARYEGPIVDAHIHLYSYTKDRHPWLEAAGLEALRRDHLPRDFAEVARPAGVTASVHVEAGRRPGEELAETEWLTELRPPPGVADRFVAHVPLDAPDAPALIERQAANGRVVGVRDIVAWHPDAAKSARTERDRMTSPAWRRGFAALARHGLAFDLLMTPWQVEDVCRLAADHPETTLAINHCGSPLDRDDEGMARWRHGLKRLAAAGNTVIKISDAVAYDPDWTESSLRDVIRTCVDAFGADRAMFASDFPLAGLRIAYDRWIDIVRDAIADATPWEQAGIFHRTAARTYRLTM